MIPLTIIGGYLGAGKTTFINRLLAQSPEPIGVCVNDFGELNVDAELLQHPRGAGETIELSNGCVCCQLTDSLGAALESLAEHKLSQVLVEASGVALPGKLARYGHNWPGYRLQGLYTLADVAQIETWLNDKYVGQLAQAQLDEAWEILLTKLDLVPESATLDWLARTATPARPLPADSVDWFFNSAEQNAQNTQRQPTTEQSSSAELLHSQSALSAFTYRTANLIDPVSLQNSLISLAGVPRVKGWLVNDRGEGMLVQQAGQQIEFTPAPGIRTTALTVLYVNKVTDRRRIEARIAAAEIRKSRPLGGNFLHHNPRFDD